MRKLLKKAMLAIVLASVFAGTRASYGGVCDDLESDYNSQSLKVSSANPPSFTTSSSSTYFSSSEIKSSYSSCYYYDSNFWGNKMDGLRGDYGPIVLNSAFRTPVHNDNTPGAIDHSLHQYSRAADVGKVDGVEWSSMSQAEKDDFHDTAENTYGLDAIPHSGYIHLELGVYCDIVS